MDIAKQSAQATLDRLKVIDEVPRAVPPETGAGVRVKRWQDYLDEAKH